MKRTSAPSQYVRILLLALVSVAMLEFSGCSTEETKSEFAGPDWSRGVKLGTANINNRAGVVWDSQTRSTIAAWIAESDAWHFEVARINDQGQPSAMITLPFEMRFPSKMRFVQDSEGGLHLFWLDSASGGGAGVYHALVSADVAVLEEPRRLSADSSNVTGYSVVEAVSGALDLFWSDAVSGQPQLYDARMSFAGDWLAEPHDLGVAGSDPACVRDSDGAIHLAWNETQVLGSQEILYATFDAKARTVGETFVLDAFPMGTGLGLHPVEIGLETGRVYVFWSLEQRAGGLSPGTAETHYRSFPIGHPKNVIIGILQLPNQARPDYVTAAGAFNYQALHYLTDPGTGQLIPVDSPGTYTYQVACISGQREETGLLLSSQMALPKRSGNNQIAFVTLQGGQVKGYETAAMMPLGSLRPIGAADDQGGVHLVWLSPAGFGAYDVYYASTAASVRTALNRVTWGDVWASVAGKTWSAATGLSFFPMLVLWYLLPFALMVGFYLFRPDSDLTTRAGRIALILAIVLYLFSKFFIMPGFLWYAPLLDIVSARYENLVVFGFPVLLMGLGLLAMRSYVRRSDKKVVLFAFMIFAGIDSILSLILYMPNAMSR